MTDYLHYEAFTGGYEAAADYAVDINDFYARLAELIHTQPRNIAWAASATDAYARALSVFNWKAGDVILTTNNDYVSNQLAFFSLREKCGVNIVRANDLEAGGVDPESIAALIDQHRPVLVAVTHIPTNSGLVQPVETIGKICREKDVWYLVDACQSAGQRVLNVEEMGCDFLTATLRKFMRGPRGAGFLYVSDRALDAGLSMLLPDMTGAVWTGPDTAMEVKTAKRFEYFEQAPVLKIGTAVAVRYLLATGQQAIQDRVVMLAAKLRDLLQTVPEIRVLDVGPELSGIVTAGWTGDKPELLRDQLRQAGLNISVSGRTMAQIDFARKNADYALRFSPHYYNTEAEIEAAAGLLREALEK